MQRKAIFTSNGLIEEIKRKTGGNQKEVYIEDMMNGAYHRCFGVVFDDEGNLILRIKSLEDLYDDTARDLYQGEW